MRYYSSWREFVTDPKEIDELAFSDDENENQGFIKNSNKDTHSYKNGIKGKKGKHMRSSSHEGFSLMKRP